MGRGLVVRRLEAAFGLKLRSQRLHGRWRQQGVLRDGLIAPQWILPAAGIGRGFVDRAGSARGRAWN